MKNSNKFAAALVSFFVILLSLYLLLLKIINLNSNEDIKQLYSQNIDNKIEIFYDKTGIPHIKAESIKDIMFGLGYTHAENRFWQMDFFRHVASGRLSEIFGLDYLEMDKFLRLFNLTNVSSNQLKNYPSEFLELLEAYSAGVNTFLENNDEKLSIEFSIFDYKPEFWRPIDCVLLYNFLDLLFNSTFLDNFALQILMSKLPYEELADLFNLTKNPIDSNIYYSQQNYYSSKFNQLSKLYDSLSKHPFIFNPAIGNAFGISNNLTEKKKWALCVDYATPLSIPNLFFLTKTHTSNFSLTGFYFPGVPFSFSGSNQKISWVSNFLNLKRHRILQFDTTALKNNKDSMTHSHNIEFRVDTFKVKNSFPRFSYLKFLNNNGIIDQLFGLNNLDLIINYNFDNSNKSLYNLYKINFADNLSIFSNINQDWSYPLLNIVFADNNGNIGMCKLGKFYHQKKSFFKVNDSLQSLWNGITKPKSHFLISTNYATDTISNSIYEGGFRYQRISEFLTNLKDFESRDLKNIQLDTKSDFARNIIEILKEVINDKIYLLSNEETKIYNKLINWDYSFTRNSLEALILDKLSLEIVKNLFLDHLSSKEIDLLINLHNFPEIFANLLKNKNSEIYDNKKTSEKENRDYIIFSSAKKIFQTFSSQIKTQKVTDKLIWGNFNKLAFNHFAPKNIFLTSIYNLDSIQSGGHRTTINYSYINHQKNLSYVVTSRLLFFNNNQIDFILSLGNSGDPTSDHFIDQYQVWKNGGYLKLIDNIDQKMKLKVVITKN